MDFDLETADRWAQLLSDTRMVMPEIWLVIAMCVVILVPFINRTNSALPIVSALAGLVLAGVYCLPLTEIGDVFVFSGMLTIDPFSQFFKLLLIIFTILIVAQWQLTARHETDVKDIPDYLCLLLGATVGMALMASASNLLMIFLAIESASLPSFALAGFRKRHRLATEGSLKYVLFGAAASAIGVYGMSLVYGSTGTLSLAGVAEAAARPAVVEAGVVVASAGFTPLLGVGLMAMFASIAFKLSAAPLHFWCPDVFQGASIEITTFLSVASKGAAVCLLVRILQTFGAHGGASGFIGLASAVGILGAVTATWGNLVAFHQTNIKRLLAYSSIAHAGYMIMGAALCTMVAVPQASQVLAGAILFYLMVYMFMNLGAFTVAALLAEETGSEDIRDYVNLIGRSPALAVLLSIFLLSLFGMPGLGGFMAKIFLGMAMFELKHPAAFALVAVLLLNTLISLYYYVRPIYYMVFMPDEQSRPSFSPRLAGLVMLLICALALMWTGILPGTAGGLTKDYATLVVRPPASKPALPRAGDEPSHGPWADRGEPGADPAPSATGGL